MPGTNGIQSALSEDLADEREGVRTYAQHARQFQSREPAIARTVRSIRADEKKHVRQLQRSKRQRSRRRTR